MGMNPQDMQNMILQMQGQAGDQESFGEDTAEAKKAPEELNKPDNSMSDDEQRDFIRKAYRRFQLASNGMDKRHKEWRLLDLFDRGKQWDTVQIPVWVPKPITNLIRYVRTTKRANLAQAIPTAQFSPLTPLDMPLVRQVQKAYNHVWEEQHVSMTCRRCVDRSLLHGTSIVYVYAEENIRGKYYGDNHESNQLYKYDVKIKKLNNANFFVDPTAYNIGEAKFIDITENLAWSDVKNNPIFKEFAGKKLKDMKFADLERTSDAAGDIYDRDVTKSDETLMHETGDEMVTLHIHWERFRNEDGAWQVDVSYYIFGADFLLYRIEDFKPSIFPFSVLYDEEEDASFWGTSTAMDMLENQKIINKTSQAASIIGTLNQNPQKVVLRDSGINAAEMSRTGTLAGKVWTSNIPNAVETIQPPDIPKGLFEIEDRMKADIKDMAGINEAYTGNSVGSLTTSTGVDSLIERSTVRDRDKSLQIDMFVKELSNIIAMFILVYWQEERPLMTRSQNGSPSFDTWKPVPAEVVDNLEWRVYSDVYAKAPITAASKSQQADNLMQMQGQFQFDPPVITPEEWIEMKDFPNKEDILTRMQADRQNKQAQDQNQIIQQINQIIGQAQQLKAQGVSDQNVQGQIQPMVQQLVQKTFTSGTNQGTQDAMIDSGSSAPQGTTSPTAMGNMTKG